MNSENNDCMLVQENIAWGRALSDLDQNHVLSCPRCSGLAMDFEEIDSAIRDIEVVVPVGFADKVMANITFQQKQHEPSSGLREFFMSLFDNQILRWGIGGTSFLLAFSAH